MFLSDEHGVFMQARLKSLGVGKTVSELRKQVKEQRPPRRSYQKKVYRLTPLRRSLRISNNLTPPQSTSTPLSTPKQGLAFYLCFYDKYKILLL